MTQFMVCFLTAALAFALTVAPFPGSAQPNPTRVEELRQLGAQLLTAPQIAALVTGKTLRGQIAAGPDAGQIRSHRFETDGKFTSTNSWDNRSDGSKWYVREEGQLCRRYLAWYNKKVICRQVTLFANRYYWTDANGQVTDIIFERQ